MIKNRFQTGFTLIELVVVSAIIVIMTAVGLVSFRGLRSSQEINSARSDTISQLREIQSFVLNGKIVPGQTKPATAYEIILTVGSDTYQINSDVNGTISPLKTVRYGAVAGGVTLSSLTVNGSSVASAVVRVIAPYGTILVGGQQYQIVTAVLRQG